MLQTYVRPKFVLERGEGAKLWDTDGKEYLDFAAGIAVNSLGASHTMLDLSCKALSQTMPFLLHVCILHVGLYKMNMPISMPRG